MEFAHPWALALLPLALVPILWRRRRTALRFSSFRALPPDPLSRALELAERTLGVLFVTAAALAVSGPRTTPHPTEEWTRGARLVFVVDQSASMFSPWSGAPEPATTKIAVAKEAIREFVDRRRSDEVALIGFGKATILYAPPTADRGRFLETLGLLQTDLGDTVIDNALLRALRLLDGDEDGSAREAVVLLSDGAGRMREPEAIAQEFRAAGVGVYWLRIEGGGGADEKMHAFMDILGARGRTFVVGEVNELPQALETIGRIESRLLRAEGWTEGRTWTTAFRTASLAALLLLGVFAFGDRAARERDAAGEDTG